MLTIFKPTDFVRIDRETLTGELYQVEFVATRRAYGVAYDATFTVEPRFGGTVCNLVLTDGRNEQTALALNADLLGACDWFNKNAYRY